MKYYSFIIDDKKVGYYETEDTDGVLYQNAYLEMGGNKFENKFLLRHKDGNAISFKCGDDNWIELSKFGENAFPTCALEVICRSLKKDGSVSYAQVNEGKEAISGIAKLVRIGNEIVEYIDGNMWRRILLDDYGEILEFGWGGTAKSVKVKDRATAVKDTSFT